MLPLGDAGEPCFVQRAADGPYLIELESLVPFFDRKSVAIVGNDARILERRDGPEIDRHDIVIRMNLGLPKKSTSPAERPFSSGRAASR